MKFWKKWFGKNNKIQHISDEISYQPDTLDLVILDDKYNEVTDRQIVIFNIFVEEDRVVLRNINNVKFNVIKNIKREVNIFMLLKNNKPINSGSLSNSLYIDKTIVPNFLPRSLEMHYHPSDVHFQITNGWTMTQVME